MHKTSVMMLLALVGLGLSNVAAAMEEDEWASALEIPCHPLVTAAECRVHRDHLASLSDSQARDDYLAKHVALIEDRVRACGCSLAQNAVGALEYR